MTKHRFSEDVHKKALPGGEVSLLDDQEPQEEEDPTPWNVLPVGSHVTIGGRTGVVISRWFAIVNVRFDDGAITKVPVTKIPND